MSVLGVSLSIYNTYFFNPLSLKVRKKAFSGLFPDAPKPLASCDRGDISICSSSNPDPNSCWVQVQPYGLGFNPAMFFHKPGTKLRGKRWEKVGG